MHHNFLSNYCLFYSTIQTKQCFKILSVLDTMNTLRMPLKNLEYNLYEGRREIKQINKPKEKNLKTEFELTVIKDQDVHFMYNREKIAGNQTKGGHMTISSREFFDIMQRNRLIGEISVVKSIRMVMQSFIWQNYIITHYQLSKEKSLLIIQEVFSSTLFNLNNEEGGIVKKTKLLFEPLLQLMFNPERAGIELVKFQKELRTLKALYPELEREIDKEKKIVQTNYSLIYYHCIMQAVREMESL